MNIRDHPCLTEHRRNFSPLGFTIRKTRDFQPVCVSLLIVLYILVALCLCIVAHFLYVYGYVCMVMHVQVTHACVQVCLYTCGIQRETSSMVPRVYSNFSFLLIQSLLGPGLTKNNRKSRHRSTGILLFLLPMMVTTSSCPHTHMYYYMNSGARNQIVMFAQPALSQPSDPPSLLFNTYFITMSLVSRVKTHTTLVTQSLG